MELFSYTCIHGIVEYAGSMCILCNKDSIQKLQEDIQHLQNLDKAQTSLSRSLLVRINKLEEKISEKYAHPDVIGRIERLEFQIKGIADIEKCQNTMVKDIEEIFKSIEIRIDNIEISHINDITRTPHKCPICNGSGKQMNVLLSMPPIYPDCNACKGKGIVWNE